MARGVNKCLFIGNVGNIETRFSSNGEAIVNLSLGVSEQWKDKQGQKQEHTEWVRVVIFGQLASIASEYVNKGAKLYICGKQKTRKWQDNNGNDRYTTEIVANEMQFLDSRQDGQQARPQQTQQRPAQAPSVPADDFDDGSDIPF